MNPSSSSKQDIYSEALTEVLLECIGCSPDSWTQGRLTIACDGFRIDYSLKNEGSSDRAEISEELRTLCEMLWSTFSRHGDRWTQAVLDYRKNDEGSWEYDVKFHYQR